MEPDFLVNSDDFKVIVDAKYKPRYEKGNPTLADARQLAGYARLNAIYKELELEDDRVIPTYFIYPSQLQILEQVEDVKQVEEFESIENQQTKLIGKEVRLSKKYREMYLESIDLPIGE